MASASCQQVVVSFSRSIKYKQAETFSKVIRTTNRACIPVQRFPKNTTQLSKNNMSTATAKKKTCLHQPQKKKTGKHTAQDNDQRLISYVAFSLFIFLWSLPSHKHIQILVQAGTPPTISFLII